MPIRPSFASLLDFFSRNTEFHNLVLSILNVSIEQSVSLENNKDVTFKILEIIKNDHDMSFSTHLVEKSPKKGKFLEKANSFLDLNLKIHNCDVNSMSKKEFTTLISRAFKPMKIFFEIISDAQLKFKKIIMMKGENFMDEFNEAKKYFEINCDIHESMTNPGSKLFVIKGVTKL